MLPRAQPARSRRFDVVGLGQNSVDHLFQIEAFPDVGTKTRAAAYHLLPGGQVATAILASSRLGLSGRYIGAVGDDALGARACDGLEREGVTLELKVVRGAVSQFAMIMVDGHGDRTIVEHRDPRTRVEAADLRQQWIETARVLHLDLTDLPAALRAATWARQAGTLVSLDVDHFTPGAAQLLALVDLLVASEDLVQEPGASGVKQALHDLQGRCPGFICITRGERGCAALDGDEIIGVPAFQVDAVDTTGCGDVFRGALIHGALRRWDARRCLRFAAAAAALQAGSLGAQTGVPGLEQVRAFLDSDPQIRDNG